MGGYEDDVRMAPSATNAAIVAYNLASAPEMLPRVSGQQDRDD